MHVLLVRRLTLVAKLYKRRGGVIWRPGQLGVPREPRTDWLWRSNWVNDGWRRRADGRAIEPVLQTSHDRGTGRCRPDRRGLAAHPIDRRPIGRYGAGVADQLLPPALSSFANLARPRLSLAIR